jgi:hypothetical protein
MLGLTKKGKKDKTSSSKSEKKEKKEKKGTKKGSAGAKAAELDAPVYSTKAQRTLLVIDSDSRDWAPLFAPVQGPLPLPSIFIFICNFS